MALTVITLWVIVSPFVQTAIAQTIKLAHSYPQGHLADTFMNQLAEQANRTSGGRLAIRVFPARALGAPEEVLDKLKKGDVELALISPEVLSPAIPEFALFRLPHLFTTYSQADEILDGEFGRSLVASAQNAGVGGLGLLDQGFVDLVAGRPVRSPRDLKGAKVRVPQDPVRIASSQALGAVPVPLVFAEVYVALQRGLVDALEVSVEAAVAMRLYEVRTYFSLIRSYYRADALLASSGWLSSLDQSARSLLAANIEQTMKQYRDARRQREASEVERLRGRGMSVITDVNIAEFQKAVRSLYEKEPLVSIVKRLRGLKCPRGCPLPPICCSR
jgi:tripartite ATP-independent transporter DctP family solute receptor